MIEDAQSVVGFGGQISNVVCPRKILAASESQEFELLNFLKRIVKKVKRRVCQKVLSERWSEFEISQHFKTYAKLLTSL